jgi:cellulose synthase/poly-beta-1,6-N-acetylglucosamine synthase-like glycosyltransferase
MFPSVNTLIVEHWIILVWLVIYTFFTIISIRTLINIIASLKHKARREDSIKMTNGGYAPFVTIILPTYNEPKVISRLLKACTNIDYTNYEIIVADDSTDEETLLNLKKWRNNPKVKIIHRDTRKGFKAGAINNALKYINPLTEYILIFDADYIPPRNIIKRMLEHFNNEEIAAVQGYTQHTLNENKNYITKSVRLMFSYYCMTEIPGRSAINGFIPLMGSVFMIRRDILEKIGYFNESSITEDWDLAAAIRMLGYKIIYDENIKVPAECPSNFKSLLRQQIRWSEGITRDTRKRLIHIIKNKNMNIISKIDFIISGFYGVQSILGILSYIFGQYHINVNFLFALGPIGYYYAYIAPNIYPLTLIIGVVVGLYREKELSKIPWIPYLIIVISALTPFIAYGTIRGLLLNEGSWIRTPKTGEITYKGDLAGEEEPKEKEPELPVYIRPILLWTLSY